MKALKRVIIAVIFIPLIIFGFFEIIFYAVRWIITSKDFPDEPIFTKLIFKNNS